MSAPHTPTQRFGVTLLELLVVLFIIGLLFSLTLKAVQFARESQRRVTCQSRLRQMGIATSSFVSSHGYLPEAGRTTPPTLKYMSAHALLLPQLDYVPLYKTVTRRSVFAFSRNLTVGGPDSFGKLLAVPLFSCPSDPVRAGSSYRACTGSNHNSSAGPGAPLEWGNGAFPRFRRLGTVDIKDGMSNTAAFSEKMKSDYGDARYEPTTDVWLSRVHSLRDPSRMTVEEFVQLCRAAPRSPVFFFGKAGFSWLYGRYDCTLYNHAVQPNAPIPDCDGYGVSAYGSVGIYRASSYHPGGVNVTMLDGSTRFVTEEIDLTVWRALATRNGGEIYNGQ